MPTLILTGHPCSGKSTFAALLAARAPLHKSGAISSAVVISEATACPDRTTSQCCEHSRAEKSTRGALKDEFDKRCSCSSGDDDDAAGGERRTGRLVILDATNYIKGFRYELHCIAKAAGERHGVVWVLCDAGTADGWNRERRRKHEEEEEERQAASKGGGGGEQQERRRRRREDYYAEGQMEELRRRYEPPDSRNRWDRPLYRVDVNSTLERVDGGIGGGTSAEAALEGSVYDMHALSEVMPPSSKSAIEDATTVTAGAAKKPSSAFRRKKPSSAFRRAAPPPPAAKQDRGGVGPTPAAEEATPPAPQDVGPQNSSAEARSNAASSPTEPTPKPRRKMEDLIDEILDSFLSKEVTPLKRGMSTTKPVTTNANVLHDVDAIAQRTGSALLAAQKSVAAVGYGRVSVAIIASGGEGEGEGDGKGERRSAMSVNLTRTVQVAEMRRMRRQYVRWISDHPPRDTSEAGIATSFLSYVETQL